MRRLAVGLVAASAVLIALSIAAVADGVMSGARVSAGFGLALVQRELLLDTMVQNTPVAMVLVDPARRIVLGNLAARRMLGQGKRLEGRAFDEVLAQSDVAVRDALERGGDGMFTVGDADDDAITAVLIVPPELQNPDRALVINLRDECAPGLFDRVLEVVPADDAERAGSRERWKTYKAAGFEVAKHDM